MDFCTLKRPNLFNKRLSILLLLNMLISIFGLLYFSTTVSGESYSENSNDFHILKEWVEPSKDRHRSYLKEVGIISAELVGGCTLNVASFLICLSALEMEGDDPEASGIVMSTILAPVVSSLAVTGGGCLFRGKGS